MSFRRLLGGSFGSRTQYHEHHEEPRYTDKNPPIPDTKTVIISFEVIRQEEDTWTIVYSDSDRSLESIFTTDSDEYNYTVRQMKLVGIKNNVGAIDVVFTMKINDNAKDFRFTLPANPESTKHEISIIEKVPNVYGKDVLVMGKRRQIQSLDETRVNTIQKRIDQGDDNSGQSRYYPYTANQAYPLNSWVHYIWHATRKAMEREHKGFDGKVYQIEGKEHYFGVNAVSLSRVDTYLKTQYFDHLRKIKMGESRFHVPDDQQLFRNLRVGKYSFSLSVELELLKQSRRISEDCLVVPHNRNDF